MVTYNPRTAAKQRYAFDRKLLEPPANPRSPQREGQDPEAPLDRCGGRIEKHTTEKHASSSISQKISTRFAVEKHKRKWTPCFFERTTTGSASTSNKFGKNILITDHSDWTTDEIVSASLDRYMVESAFRQSKDDDLVSVIPLRHWTDRKIRCHILTCVVALDYLRLIELRLIEQASSSPPRQPWSRCTSFTPAFAGGKERRNPSVCSKTQRVFRPRFSELLAMKSSAGTSKRLAHDAGNLLSSAGFRSFFPAKSCKREPLLLIATMGGISTSFPDPKKEGTCNLQ